MARGLRKATPTKLPEGVKPATVVPILVIPSAGHSAKMDGNEQARRQPFGTKKETEVRLRYAPCCDEHKQHIKVSSLESPQQLLALTTRLTAHLGHGRLLPEKAHIEWEACQEKVACADCQEDFEARSKKTA
ncbi:MAG: hypothetical protein KGL39_49515 [Patescibacteria group bacterium]|nr:hypothetical protein [Patescibacteria group bacterium]